MENKPKISDQLLEDIRKESIAKTFKSGEIILQENDYVRSIPFVINGRIKVMRTEEDGREILLYYITSGESCVMSFFGGIHQKTSKVRAEVEEDAEILFLPNEKISGFLKDYPQFLDYVLRLYHKRFEELLEMVNEVTFKKIDQRLINLLQKKAELNNSATIIATHEQIANELGTARVVISRILKNLEEQKIIKLGRNKIELL